MVSFLRRFRDPQSFPGGMIAVWGAVFLYALVLSFLMRNAFIDDAYIGYRYIDNLTHGQGFVFNPPDRIEGVTNIGWLLVLTPFSLFFDVTAVAKALSFFLLLGAVAATVKLARFIPAENGRSDAALFLPLAIVTNFDFSLFSSTGMETALLAFGLAAMIWLAVLRSTWVGAAFLGAFVFLVHPESALVFPLALAFFSGFDAARWIKKLPSLAVFLALIAGITIVRKLYFGDFLPNTFYAKPSAFGSLLENALLFLKGLNGNIPVPFYGWLALPLWAYGLRRLWRSNRTVGSFAAAALCSGGIFALYAQRDWTALGRYFSPYIPIATLASVLGLAGIARLLPSLFSKAKRQELLVSLACILLITVGVGRTLIFLFTDQSREYPGFIITGVSLVEPSLWIRDHIPEKAVIATGRLGAVSYFSGKRIFDYKYGLTERPVGRLRQKLHREFVDPRDPALGDLWTKAEPGYFLEDTDRIIKSFQLNRKTMAQISIHGMDYRLLKTFKIGLFKEWAFYERVR